VSVRDSGVVPQTFENSLGLLGQAAGGIGVGLFTTGIILRRSASRCVPTVIASALGKNALTPLAALGIAYLFGQGAAAGEVAVTAAILRRTRRRGEFRMAIPLVRRPPPLL
jgi:predicted permease